MTTSDKHKAPAELSGHHAHTYEAIFRHPTTHNLEWHDVLSMLGALADVEEEQNGSVKIKRNGELLTLRTPKHKGVATIEDILAIRHFLEQSGSAMIAPPVASGARLLVVIDHHEAKIYSTESKGSVPQKLVPHDPQGFVRSVRSNVAETAGKRNPELKSFYEAIAKTLHDAEEILIFGTGTGESSAMDHLVADLRHNHGDLANRIIGTVVVDEHHLTEDQLLAKAREFFGPK